MWKTKIMIKEMVWELTSGIEAKSNSAKMVELVMDRSWTRIKFRRVWDILESDRGLQKTIMRLIMKQEEDAKKIQKVRNNILIVDVASGDRNLVGDNTMDVDDDDDNGLESGGKINATYDVQEMDWEQEEW
jgi:hypothetical protein